MSTKLTRVPTRPVKPTGGELEFGVRELRNDTSKVLEALNSGDTVYLTNRGVRVAQIVPITRRRKIDRLLERAAMISQGDSGALDELMASKGADIEAQRAKEDMLWG